jgi:hypothetical protein
MCGIVRKKMHAADNGIGLEHQVASGGRAEKSGVI